MADNITQDYNVARIGMDMDSSINQVAKGKLCYALNSAVENYDNNSTSYQNEPGNELCLTFPFGYQLIGEHFIQEKNKHIFFLANPSTNSSEIGYMDNNDCVYHTLINASCLNFSIHHPIPKIVHKITNCSTEIYWTDGYNPRRFLDIEKIPYKIIPGTGLCNGQHTQEVDCNQLNMQPNFPIPQLIVVDVINGGSLKAGTVQFSVQYSDAAGNGYTSYYSVTNPTPINDPHITTLNFDYEVGKSVVINISNLDITGDFQYFNLAVIKTINAITSVDLVGTYFIDKGEKEITYSGQNQESIHLSINDIFEKTPFYEIAQDLTTAQDVLIWDNLTSIDKINYQSIWNQVILQWQTWRIPSSENYADELNATNLRGYLRDEVYTLEGVFLLDNGKQTDRFHIPGRMKGSTELTAPDVPSTNPDFVGSPDYSVGDVGYSAYWKIYNTANLIGFSPQYNTNKDYKGEYQYGEFAYWESSELYPCNEDVWGSLANTPIRHHKLPDILISPIFESPIISSYNNLVMQEDAIFPIGIKIDIEQIRSLVSASGLTQEQKDAIVGFKIVRGDRGTNKSIVAKGMLRNVGKYKREETEYLYPNYPYNDTHVDPFLLSKSNAYTTSAAFGNTGGLVGKCRNFTVRTYITGVLEYLDCYTNELTSIAITAGETISLCALNIPKTTFGGANITGNTYDIYRVVSTGSIIRYVPPSNTCSSTFCLTNPTDPCCNDALISRDIVVGTFPTVGVITIPSLTYPDIVSSTGDTQIIFISSVGDTCAPTPLNGMDFITAGYRHVFNSPETSFGQPFLGNILKAESVIFGAGKAHFVQVKKNALYKLLSKEAQLDALASADNIANITSPYNAVALFAAYQAYLTIYINGITRRNYGYSFNSIASYDYEATIPNDLGLKQRELDIAQYLIPGVQNVGDILNINNYQREGSVYLKTIQKRDSNPVIALPFPSMSPSLSGVIQENSRFTISDKGNCNNPTKEEYIDVVSYYASIKNFFPSQWGQIYSYESVDTGFQINLKDINTPVIQTIFGGDTFINRFAYKTKIPFFIDNRVGAPDDSDIFYDELGNVAYPKYWFSARSVLSSAVANQTLTNFISVKAHNLDCPNSQTPVTSPGRTYYDGKMYLFAYGIPSFYCESSVNVDLRQAFNSKEGDFFPHVSTGIPDDWVQESFVTIAQDNTYYYNVTYSKQNKENFFTSLPPNWEEQLCFTNFPFRAIYSDSQNDDPTNKVNGWLTYAPLSLFDFPQNYGKLTSLDGIQNKAVLARFENKSLLYNTLLTIDTSNPQAAYLGNGSLFRSSPPIDFAETDLGYVGSQHKMLLKIPQGQITLDAKRGQVFLIEGNGATDLSAFGSGMNRFFTDHLAFEILRFFPTINVDNHFNGIGLHGVYDSKYDRVIISKLDYVPLNINIKYNDLTQEFYIIKTLGEDVIHVPVYLSDKEYFCNKSWTLSFNLNTKSWVSFHSYIPNWYIGENNFFYSGINDCCSDIDSDNQGFDILVGTRVNLTTTTTSSTSSTSTTTTTTTIVTPECILEGTISELHCAIEGEAISACMTYNGSFDLNLFGWDIVDVDSWQWSPLYGGTAAYHFSDEGGLLEQDILQIGHNYRCTFDLHMIDGGCAVGQTRVNVYMGTTISSDITAFGVYTVDVTLTCAGNTIFKIQGYDNCSDDDTDLIFIKNVCVTEVFP